MNKKDDSSIESMSISSDEEKSDHIQELVVEKKIY